MFEMWFFFAYVKQFVIMEEICCVFQVLAAEKMAQVALQHLIYLIQRYKRRVILVNQL